MRPGQSHQQVLFLRLYRDRDVRRALTCGDLRTPVTLPGMQWPTAHKNIERAHTP